MKLDSDSLARKIAELSEMADQAGQGRLHWQDFTQTLVGIVPGTLGSLMHSQADASRAIVAPVGYDPELVRSYGEHFVAVNPWNSFWAAADFGKVYTSSKTAPSRRYKNTEFYEDWLMKLDGRAEGIGIKMSAMRDDVLSILLHLPDKALDDAEALYERVLSGVSAAVTRAISFNLMLHATAEKAAAVAALVERLPDTAVVLDASLNIIDANAAAEASFRVRGLIRNRASKLVIADRRAHDWLRSSLQHLLLRQPMDDDRIVVRAGSEVFKLSVFSVPDHRTAFGSGLFQRSLFLLVVRDLGRERETDLKLLATHFRLSPAEVRMCAAFVGGLTLNEVAEQVGIARETARHRLKQIFQKTGTNRQSELIALLLRIG